MSSITNHDDIIDSRDVIERIEELREMHIKFVTGYNVPGYMPDNEPSGHSSWEEARDSIAWELNRAIDETDDADQIKALEEAIDSLNATSEGEEWAQTVAGYAYWLTINTGDDGLTDDEREELKSLEDLAKQGEGFEDWEHGATLIRDSYFKTYAAELADDIGALPKEYTWPTSCIDWDKAAWELRMDYSSVEFDGVTYWLR